jgi:hypothetical protein
MSKKFKGLDNTPENCDQSLGLLLVLEIMKIKCALPLAADFAWIIDSDFCKKCDKRNDDCDCVDFDRDDWNDRQYADYDKENDQ